ncbi:Polyadenylate-binding protein [Actinidia chinensis var. chinensis]|uniref:Polyadenylate-binding protein n=1 Tax=Actinidia chinensis var. chinensis TaxID=1590841 RepID=A0A2R6R3E5_ACTCC|nr:Polyadenylate-binding protein [Actinidia chinensis var. chinensis]
MQSNNGSDPQNQSQQNHAVAAAAQQQWMAMQYPAMVMPPQMMHYPPQYMPYHHHQYHHQFHPQQQQHQQQQPGSNGENKTIWIGDLQNWMDEDYLHSCFASTGEIYDLGYIWRMSRAGGYVSSGASAQGSQSDGDYTNTTIFVGGLGPNVKDEDLRQPFSQYGEIVSVKIPVRRGCGFVQFANRNNAEEALQKLNGTTIADQTVRLSWGRNPANKQRADFGNSLSGAYYGGQIYDGFGYAVPQPHDPSMYAAAAAAYGAYPVYGTHQQQVS